MPLPAAISVDLLVGATPREFATIAVGAVAVGLAPPAGANAALVQVTDQNIRWRADGNAPTAAAGVQATPGTILTVTGYNSLRTFQAIREGGVSGNLQVQFYELNPDAPDVEFPNIPEVR